MPRASRPWFRFYVEAMRDPKMRRLTPAQRWLWVAVLSAARESCLPGFLMVSERVAFTTDDLADYAGMKPKEVEEGIERMAELGMLDTDPNLKAWFVPSWNDRQFESDDVTARTSRHRSKEQRRNVPTSFVGTPPDTETETDADPSSSSMTQDDDDDPIFTEALRQFAELKMVGKTIDNRAAYRRTTMAEDRAEWLGFRAENQHLDVEDLLLVFRAGVEGFRKTMDDLERARSTRRSVEAAVAKLEATA